MDKHCSNSLKLASFLNDHSQVRFVGYPGLNSHSQFDLAETLFDP